MPAFVPADFDVPAGLETPDFRIRPLLISDVVKDYDAVMTSAEHLQGVFGPGREWPGGPDVPSRDLMPGPRLAPHKEFQRRSSFAYTVMSLDGANCLGCLYISPSRLPGYGTEGLLLDPRQLRRRHDGRLLDDALRGWISARWPFQGRRLPRPAALGWDAAATLHARDGA